MGQPQMADAKWFWRIGDQQHGPVSMAQMQGMARAGQLGPQVTVWTEGMAEWVPAARLPVLFAPPAEDHGALHLLLPMGPQSGLSIAAGYCGLIGLLVAPLAPLGLVFGILGMRDIKHHPEKRGRGRAITGIVLGGLASVLWLVVLVSALAHRR